jgi:hypothetical protein
MSRVLVVSGGQTQYKFSNLNPYELKILYD